MSLQDLWRGFVQSLVTLIIFTVLGIALAVAYIAVTPKSFTAKSRIFVTSSNDTAGGTDLVKNAIGSFVELVQTPPVLSPAAQTLGISEGNLKSKVSVDNPLNTTLLDISVRASSATKAKLRADTVSASAVAIIPALQSSVGIAKRSPVRLTIVSPAGIPSSATTPNRKLDVVLGALVGFGLGLLIAGARGMFLPIDRSDRAAPAGAESMASGAPSYDEDALTYNVEGPRPNRRSTKRVSSSGRAGPGGEETPEK